MPWPSHFRLTQKHGYLLLMSRALKARPLLCLLVHCHGNWCARPLMFFFVVAVGLWDPWAWGHLPHTAVAMMKSSVCSCTSQSISCLATHLHSLSKRLSLAVCPGWGPPLFFNFICNVGKPVGRASQQLGELWLSRSTECS